MRRRKYTHLSGIVNDNVGALHGLLEQLPLALGLVNGDVEELDATHVGHANEILALLATLLEGGGDHLLVKTLGGHGCE